MNITNITLSLFFLVKQSNGYSHPNHDHKVNEIPQPETSRRSFLAPSIIIPLTFIAKTPTAEALKPKNEALCGTGFFEHIYEYKCTGIGDIEDEGNAKGMSKSETGISESLMGKLGLPAEESIDTKLRNDNTNEDITNNSRNLKEKKGTAKK